MPIIRFLMRYLANNEQLIERLAQSSLMRRAAQITLYFSLKWKEIGLQSLENLKRTDAVKHLEHNSEQAVTKVRSFAQKLSQEFKAGLEEVKKNKPR